jgi:hypothetical protein
MVYSGDLGLLKYKFFYTDVPKKKDQLRWHSPCPSLVLDRQFFFIQVGDTVSYEQLLSSTEG